MDLSFKVSAIITEESALLLEKHLLLSISEL